MSKEQVYDEQINPLMAKIIEICKEHKVSLIADFGLEEGDDDLHCTTALLADEYAPTKAQLESLRLLKSTGRAWAMAITEETQPNGDKKVTMRRILGGGAA